MSTAIMFLAPLEPNSNEIFPVPVNRSSTSISSMSNQLLRILNRLSFAKSVVGLALIPLGAVILLLLYLPEIIRTRADELLG